MTTELCKSFYFLIYLLKVHQNAPCRKLIDLDNSSPDAEF